MKAGVFVARNAPSWCPQHRGKGENIAIKLRKKITSDNLQHFWCKCYHKTQAANTFFISVTSEFSSCHWYRNLRWKFCFGWCIFSVLKSCLFICFFKYCIFIYIISMVNVLVLLQASHFVARWKSWRGKVLATKTSGKTFLGGRSICPMVGHKKANGERVIIHNFEILVYIQWKMAHFQFYALSRNI